MPVSRRLYRRQLVAATSLLVAFGLSACSGWRPIGAGDVPRATFAPDLAADAAPASRRGGEMAAPDHLRHTVHIAATNNESPFARGLRHGGTSGLFDHTHPAVAEYIGYYSDQSPEIIARSLTRALPHLPKIRQTIDAAGLPAEIAYLPIIESHFNATARSHAGATGIWQFMRSTGQRYGLRIDGCVDERRDPIRSTEAAARYLVELHDRFEDWHLALAAYNAGEGKIGRIMRDHGVDDFWTMVDRRLLPRETAEFVPRFLAAAAVAKDADGWSDAAGSPPRGYDTAMVRVSDPLSLATVANLAGVDRRTVQALNPALACNRVPSGGYPVHLPADSVRAFRTAYANLDRRTITAPPSGRTHRVKRGESPGSIARRYGVSVKSLMRANGIRNPRQLKANSTLRIPGRT